MEDRIVLRENLEKSAKAVNHGFNWGENEIDTEKILTKKQQELYKKINDHVNVNRLYLDPYLSLENLAKKLELSPGYLSFLINNYSSNNFSDYVNELRVDQVKQLMHHPDYQNYTIVSLGLESGFNSKSTFYKAFKKFTGASPSEFKKNEIKD